MEPSVLCPRCRKRNTVGSARCQFCGAAMGTAWAAGGPTSGLAVASLILGLLGLFSLGLSSLIGLVLGIIGLRQIGQSGGTLQGRGLAIAGIVVSSMVLVVGLLFIPITAAILFPVFAQAREQARAAACMSHLKQEGVAMSIYAQDWDEHLPRKTDWCDAVLPYADRAGRASPSLLFQCPSLPNERCGQAYNAWLSAVSARQITAPARTAVSFDARGGWDLAGGPNLAAARHTRTLNMLFADGHVQRLGSFAGVVWKPSPAPRHSVRRRRRHRRR